MERHKFYIIYSITFDLVFKTFNIIIILQSRFELTFIDILQNFGSFCEIILYKIFFNFN